MNNRRISLINPKTIRPSQLFDSFFDEFFNAEPVTDLLNPSTTLKTLATDNLEIDMYETEKEVIVEAKVPGFKEENLSIKIEDNILIIEGTSQEESEQKQNRKYHIKEVSTKSIYRSLMLPVKIDAENSEAEFTNGMVKITLPKLENSQPKSIKVKTKAS